jgi:RNA polymerase sigma-70 factor (ECF subfamily)
LEPFENENLGLPVAGVFPQTRWSVVLEAQGDDPEALAKFCAAYWLPLYRFARRKGTSPSDAEDLTQAFFERLLSRDLLGSVRQERGRLRDFLLTSFSRFTTEEWRRANAQKRGGGRAFLAMDVSAVESELASELQHQVTPELEYQRSWARTIIAQAVARLGDEFAAAGKGAVFRALEDQLTDGAAQSSYKDVGAGLGLSEASARFAAFQLRKRFRELLFQIVADTVANPAEAEAELAELRKVFRD